MIKRFKDFVMKESVNLTQKEKDFLWTKMEVKKKANNLEKKTKIYNQLQGDEKISNDDEFIDILNCLEYSMKKRVKNGNAPKGKYEDAFNSLVSKLPDDWMGVKFSSLKAKQKREEREPNDTFKKEDIKKWLDKNKIKYSDTDTKDDLLKKIK